MKKMRLKALAIMAVMAICLTGCAENQIPDMTDEQIYEVSEYVAITLMKYDASNRSRLVELDADDFLEKEPVPTPQPEPEGMKPVEDTPVIDTTGGEDNVPEETVESVLALSEGLKLTYTGYDLCDSYPQDNENNYFSLFAAEGKQLLVMKFDLTNLSAEDINLNLLSKDENFTVIVNEEYSRRALTTMLDNDLSTYIGDIKGNETKQVVLLIEVDKETAAAITSISLKVQNEDKKHTIRVY